MHNLLNPDQSGFQPNDSCVYVLISVSGNYPQYFFIF